MSCTPYTWVSDGLQSEKENMNSKSSQKSCSASALPIHSSFCFSPDRIWTQRLTLIVVHPRKALRNLTQRPEGINKLYNRITVRLQKWPALERFVLDEFFHGRCYWSNCCGIRRLRPQWNILATTGRLRLDVWWSRNHTIPTRNMQLGIADPTVYIRRWASPFLVYIWFNSTFGY